MKLIMDAICTHLMHVGMTSQQAMKKHPFNMLNVTVLLIFCIDESSNVLYLVRSAAGLREYMDAIYYFITGLAAALNFAWVTWKMPEVFRFIETLEDVVNTSEFNARIKIKFVRFFSKHFKIGVFVGLVNPTLKTIYTQTSEKIKKHVGICNTALIKVTAVATTMPPALGCFVAYFTTDVGADVFELPHTSMW